MSARSPSFSSRTVFPSGDDPVQGRVAAARANGTLRVDLTESNPTRAGLVGEELLVELGHPRGARYVPDPFGHHAAREAVARYYAERGMRAAPERVVLSASTSESYGWLFKLLADPGDEVLVPEPSYPLFASLAQLEGIRLVGYPLRRDERFRVDVDALRRASSERTRAILVVHPNNPTGTFVRRDDAAAIDALACERGMAVIADEVFGDYPWGELGPDLLPSFIGERRALTFVLSGLSKVLCLPQLKLGWMVVDGDDGLVREALARLEIVADTYLSVAAPVQLALPALLCARARIQRAVMDRVLGNLSALDRAIAERGATTPARRLPGRGGWYAVLEVPRTSSEDEWVEILLRDEGVLVQPGWFFDFDREGFLILSLLPDPASFEDGVRRVLARVG